MKYTPMSKTFESTLENSSTGHLDQRFWFMQKHYAYL